MSSRGEREREFHNGKYSRVVAKIREFPCSKFCLKLSLLLPATNMWLHAFLTNFNIWWKILFFYQHKELPPKKYEKGAIFGWLIVTLCGKETKSNFNPKGGLLKGTHSYSSCYKVQIIPDKKGGFPQLLKRPDWRLIKCCDLDSNTCGTFDSWKELILVQCIL